MVESARLREDHWVDSLRLLRLDDGTYFACFEQLPSDRHLGTCISRSRDHGRSWSHVAELEDVRNPSLFAKGNDLYLQGSERTGPEDRSRLVILRSIDQGETWTEARDEINGILREDLTDHLGDSAMVEHGGRFWHSFSRDDRAQFSKYVSVVSAAVGSDLLRADSWRWSDEVSVLDHVRHGPFQSSMLRDFGATPVLLTHSGKYITMVADPSADGAKLERRGCPSYASQCESAMGPRLVRDPVSGSYFSLRGVAEGRGGRGSWMVSIDLESSSDLHTWTKRSTLLVAPSSSDPDFETADWLIEDEDLLVLQIAVFGEPPVAPPGAEVEEALIFYRVPNFRDRQQAEAPLW